MRVLIAAAGLGDLCGAVGDHLSVRFANDVDLAVKPQGSTDEL